ncbi:hypothetical protein EO087_00340 [Dyella sp. M7H15-1]|uniref:hypothetical protein n=1 Tax=Dyella sp. M7H15-1 TaxID=2501295 RepID=UPI001005231A|nr:hypothetical protein [Dyella sp. M7H15-1]QAU22614.1 hypothetical protein EO087_00340 [Dyella sp. M7H15-1]
MKRIILMAALALGGCGIKSVHPFVPVTVKVPMPMPCKVTLPQAPAWAIDALPLGSDVWGQMTALRAERLQRMGYERQLLAVIESCQ